MHVFPAKRFGKAERFIQTSMREWAYARAYNTSNERAADLPRWLHGYNWHRPRTSIGSMPPISKLALTRKDLGKAESSPNVPNQNHVHRWHSSQRCG